MHWHKFKSFLKDRSANFAVILALALIPFVVGTGAAVDYGRAYMVKARLSNALDQAGLAVGSSDPSSDRDEILNKYFLANYPAEKMGVPATPSMTINGDIIELSVNANIETAFLKLIGMNSITVTASSQIVRETTGIEVVLVLDNTGSMARDGKIDGLRIAAQDLVDIIFKEEQNPEKVFMGLVPFVATVNIGKNMRRFVNFPNTPHDYGRDTVNPPNNRDDEWKGCVEARMTPFNQSSEVSGTDIDDKEFGRRWYPYFWEAEPFVKHVRGRPQHSFCQNRWWLPTDREGNEKFWPRNDIRLYPTGRSNDFDASNPIDFVENRFSRSDYGRLHGPGSNQFRGLSLFDTSPSDIQGFQTLGSFNRNFLSRNSTFGPNQACPDPITPLTNSRATLEAAVAKMMPWAGNGTMANLGAVWGWRVLSSIPPFTEGREYDDDSVKKIMVILTDGQNLVSRQRPECFSAYPRYISHYTAYGYLSEPNVLGNDFRGNKPSFEKAKSLLDQKLALVCRQIKKHGITIYTITFGLDDASTQNLFRECASDPDKFFNSPNNETLREAFRSIGAELNNLRIGR